MAKYITIYRIRDGIIGSCRELWDSREQAMRHYGGDDYTTERLWLQGWPNTSAQIVRGDDVNGVAIGDGEAETTREIERVLGFSL